MNSNRLLLVGQTITDSCNSCHDGTGGRGVYGAIAAQGLVAVGQHRTETVTVVPGGDGATGGNRTGVFSGAGATMTCTDCHSPHGANVVAAFQGDRYRNSGGFEGRLSTKLLKQRPGDTTISVTQYGSDWCIACHRGRNSAVVSMHNHPVESSATAGGNPYVYQNIPIIASLAPTSATVMGSVGVAKAVGKRNGAFLMPFPRTPLQAGHKPICQQCHEDARFVGTIQPGGAIAAPSPFTVTTPDGATASNNPRFQNFPHESTSTVLLVESNDDLCMNCHPADVLP